MEFDIDFFRDEVRNGFYIPTAIKQAWAATLEVLSEIDRICLKHNITYYADWGTLLGAVRHGGFVPWDDDLDICMKRDDYVRFRAVADNELPKRYVFHDYERKDSHWEFLARVVNNDKMCFEEDYLLEHHNFPWLAGVDIFLKDYLYPDAEKERCRDKEVLRLYTIAQAVLKGDVNKQAISAALNEISKRYRISLPEKNKSMEVAVELYRLAEQQMAIVKPDETDHIGQIFPWVIKNGPDAGEDKELYERTIRLPFENTTIPVPACYNKVLSGRYGNYNEIRKVWTGHSYPFFEGQRAEMEKIMGQAIPGFRFDKQMLRRPETDRTASLKTTSRECVEALKGLLAQASSAARDNDLSSLLGFLTDAQRLAVDLGTFMETVKAEDNPHTVEVIKALEVFCESVWQDNQDIETGGNNQLLRSFEALDGVNDAVVRNIENMKEILFLPVGSKEWSGFQKAYEDALKEENTEVWIIPLPLLKKDYFGNVSMTDQEIEKALGKDSYQKILTLTDWRTYDFSLHCPDRVYIQNPYDDVNPCLTVPPGFYVEKIRKYCTEIIFIPFARTGEFGRKNTNDIYNMKHYVAAPGVICADQVIVQSDNIREQYINCLSDFAGKDTRQHWEMKIQVDGALLPEQSDSDVKNRKIIFGIGANELMEHKEHFAACVKERLNIFAEHSSKIDVSVYYYPNDRTRWQEVNRELSDEIFSLVEKADMEVISISPIDSDQAAGEYDAYYGSPSPLVPAFSTRGKPVMLANYTS